MVLVWMIVAIRWTTNRTLAASALRDAHDNGESVLSNVDQGQIHEALNSDARPLDKDSIAQKVENAKKVLITYGEKCCDSAKVRVYSFIGRLSTERLFHNVSAY